MAKRKASQLDDAAENAPRRSSRRVSRAAETEEPAKPETRRAPAAKKGAAPVKASKKSKDVEHVSKESKEAKASGTNKPKAAPKGPTNSAKKPAAKGDVAPKTVTTQANGTSKEVLTGKQYWLMKAEPETRLENGIDVKFSIDDLAAKTKPEPWDGIRAYPARNNLRAMKKGDLAFFYHSNCKEPGIAGIMEIVQEHSPDLSAHDSSAPYYDPNSKPSDPRWSVVHVSFVRKFAVPIGLKEMRTLADGAGKPLEKMQMLKQSRLSVSKVEEPEWQFLVKLAEEKEKEAEESG